MVVATSAVVVSHKTTRPNDPPSNLSRRPLTPSEKDNAAFSRKPRTKDIASRYLTSTTSPSFSSRRFSPTPSDDRPSTPSRRSQSADRTRPSTPRSDPDSVRANALCTTTRSLSVSFQGESFFYQTSKSPFRRATTPAAGRSDQHHRWPAASGRKPSLLTKSMDLVTSVQLLRQSFDDKCLPRRRSVCSPVKGDARGLSPVKRANAPSIISFAAEVRRGRKGEKRIEEAHVLRLLHNQHLQWRCVNARLRSAMRIQRVSAEKNLYNAWITISEVRDLVTIKKIKLHFLTQYLKLTSILKGQMVYLEETSLLDREHSSSLSGAIESIKASTLRLPVVSGARADLQEVKDAVGSAVDVMQAMGVSMYSLMSKVEGASSLVSELAKAAAQEQALLDQSRNLLSTVAALDIKHCSLRGHLLQLRRETDRDCSCTAFMNTH